MNPIYQFLKENNLTTKDEKTFERDYSDSAKAKELYGFFQENKLTEKDFNSFYDTYLKKKEPSQVVSPTGGKAGTSGVPSGFEGLKPAKVQPTEIKEPKVSGEDTALARRIQRQQQQAIASTEVKLPAAPKIVAEEKALERAMEPKLPAITKDETPKTERFFKGGFGKLLDILDTPGISIIPLGDFIDDMGRSIETGRKQGNTITPSIELMTKGSKSSPDDIRKFIEAAQNVGEIPPSDEMLKFRDTYEKEGKDIFGFIKALAQNPGVAPQIMASSISALVTNPASLTTFGSIVGGGAALGAATGPGAAATAAASLPYAMGAASGVLETGATFAELLQEELGKRKLDFTENNVRSILEDEKALSSLRSRAATRGATIGVIDALTGRIAGRVGAKIPTTTAAGRVKSGLAAAGIEAVGGSTGEAVARKAIGQEMDIAEIGLEGIAQAPTSVVSVASEIYKQPSYKINGEVRTKADVEEILANAPTEEIKNAKIEVENDPVVESQIKEKVETGDIKRELREVAPEISDEKAERIASLEKQLKKFEQGATQLSKDKAASIREEIKTISKEPEAAPKVPEAPKQKYRVEYFDPEKGEMTHSFFDTREEGDAFTSSLTEQQKSKGVQAYFQETTEPSLKVGEVTPQVPVAPEKAEVVGIDEKETIRQMKPFTDEMASIEREFENRGFKIDTDYDNEIIVTDRQGNILDPEEIPADIADLAAAYEQATMKLGEFDQVAREKALEESRKVEEVVGEEVVAPELPAAPVEEGFRPLEGFEGFEVEEGVTPIQAKQISRMKDKAMSLESTNPRTIVMQYFINGGKINKSAIQELYGISEGAARVRLKRGVPTEEMKVKKSLLGDKAPSLEALSESFAERLMQFSETQVDNRDFVDAIAEVLQEFNSVRPMIQELASEYDQQQYSGVTQGDLKDLEAAVTAELEEVVAGLPQTVKTELLQFLDKYRTAEGFVDWAKVEEVSNDFDPDYLSLSEETAKAIKDEIQRNVYGQRISRPAVEDIKKAGDAARRLAERIRQGKINKLGGFRAGTGFDAVWDASLEVIAKALEGGASVADAIEQGLKYAKSTGWYKKLTNPADFDKKYREQLNEEYNAIQVGGPEEVPVGEAPRGRKEVESGVPPTKPPKAPKEGEGAGEEGMTGISNEEALKVRFNIGLPAFERPQPESWNQLNEQADEAIRNGYNVEKLLEKLERGLPPTSVEEVILAKYAATLADTFDKTRSEDVLREYERVTNITNSIGTLTARALNVRKLLVPKEDTLADFFVIEKEETGVDELTDEQKAVITKEYEEIKATSEALQKKVEQLQEELAKKRAGEVVAQETKKVKKTKKTDQDFTNERKQIVQDIREKLKKARQESKVTFVPYANELIAISPDVAKLVKSLVEQGVIKLEDVVTEVYNTIKPEINDLTRQDVTDLIAGEYNKKKPTRGDIAAKVQDLRTEIKLINQLEALERGEIPKNPQKKIERNRELKKLRDRIKEHPTMKAADAKKRIATQIEKLEKDLVEGNYDPKPEKREIPLDAEGKKLQKKLIELRKQRDIRRIKNEYDKRTKGQKALDKVLEIANVPRSLMASTDFSAPLNQAVIATIAYPDLSAKAVQQMVKATASQDAFDQWFYELKDDPRYDLMKELRLRISDPHSPFLTAKEEAFMGGYAEQIPGVGVLVKASERAYVQYLNKLRVDLFNRFVDRFEEQGKTYENNKKLYESTAKYINNITGSGKLPKIGSVDFEQFAPFFNALLFSPRLMASRINMLNPVYFGTLPTELKIQYAKDMGSTLGLGSLLLTLFALYGKSQDDDEEKITIETDPTSSDFARIKQGDVRWDIWGGMQPYVRLFAQIGSGERKSTRTGLKQSLDGEGAFGTTRGDVLSSFVRGKLSPIPAMAVNLAQGRNAAGDKVTLEKELFSHLLPLSMQSIGEAIKEEGPSKIVSAGLPAIFGIGLQVYGDRPKEVKTTIDYKNREIELNKQQIDYFQDTYNELFKKAVEKLKKTPEYKSVDKATQVQLETQLQRLMMKKAEKKLTEKYRSEFLKAPVMTEDEKVERAKRMIKKKFD